MEKLETILAAILDAMIFFKQHLTNLHWGIPGGITDLTMNSHHIKMTILKTGVSYGLEVEIWIMHQSFASPAPPGPGNSGAFNFSIFKARVKARHCRARVLVKPLLKAPAPQGLTITWNNSWELF